MLTIENLSVEYHRRGERISAVEDVSLTIQNGETLGLVGESGSGKSTVALAIMRLINPNEGRITNGRILLDGINLLDLSEEDIRQVRGRRVSMIFQDPFTSLNPVMRIREQMEEIFTAHRLPVKERDLEEALSKVQLESSRVLSAYPHQLSGGQRQRVMIAEALLGHPELILADEPTTGLDVLVQKEILELLFNLQKDLRVSLLFISHNMGVMAQYSQKIAVMKSGRVVEEATSRELFLHPQKEYTRMLIAAIPRI